MRLNSCFQMHNKFNYTNFFQNTTFLKEFFEDAHYPWETLPKIDEFIDAFENVYKELSFKKVREGFYIGEGVVIDESAKIDGKTIIGHNSTIGHAAYLRGGVLIGQNVHIGHATEVKHSIILPDTALAHLNYVGDSILGSNINLSGGATLANFRFDKKEVFIKGDGFEIPTGLEKFGSIIGDGCFIGVNAVLNPGTILAKDCLVFPLVSVKGVHLEQETIK